MLCVLGVVGEFWDCAKEMVSTKNTLKRNANAIGAFVSKLKMNGLSLWAVANGPRPGMITLRQAVATLKAT
jgi:hypothetical protein